VGTGSNWTPSKYPVKNAKFRLFRQYAWSEDAVASTMKGITMSQPKFAVGQQVQLVDNEDGTIDDVVTIYSILDTSQFGPFQHALLALGKAKSAEYVEGMPVYAAIDSQSTDTPMIFVESELEEIK